MTTTLELPILLGGRRIEPDAANSIKFSYEGGWQVAVPEVTLADIKLVLDQQASAAAALRSVSIDDITIFLDAVGKAWRDRENKWRKIAIEWGARVTGYTTDMVTADVDRVGSALGRVEVYDMVETDLGDPAVLDDWTRYKTVFYRAWPKGLVTHVMVGNVPMAGLFTLVRSLVTKNVTIAKLPSRDVVVPQCLAQCMYDVDSSHPVTRALSTIYWKPGSDVEDAALAASDVVSVWGRASSIEAVKQRLRNGVDIIEFGPKRSFALVLDGVTDWDRVGMWLGLDVVTYNQEGCFSTQEVYVEGDPQPLADALSTWLARYAVSSPPGLVNGDKQAHVQRARMDAMAEGWEVRRPENTDWTVVVTDGPAPISEHPLMRLVYVHPIKSVRDVLPYINRDVQTVTLEPLHRAWEVADALTGAGADRVVPMGRTARMRSGFVHDGFHPLRRMVRWSTIERGIEYKYRYWRATPQDEERTFRDLAMGQRAALAARASTPPYRRYDSVAPPAGDTPSPLHSAGMLQASRGAGSPSEGR